LTETEKRFEIMMPENKPLGHDPGQFVEVSIFGFGEAPISICSSPTKVPAFDLTVRKTGRLTDKMHQLTEGNKIGIRGPFGTGFNVNDFKGKDILFVCGGIGLAPLKSLIDYTIAKRKDFGRIIILYGTKNPSEILFKDEFYLTVDRPDPTWQGHTGVITTLIPPLDLNVENLLATIVGPPVMYKFVIMALKAKRIPEDNIYLSLERRMKCGVGKCGHCQINSTYVCQDGPVFHYPLTKKLQEAI
jgi:sulfhydrogenase subunit gamma (sulfur reductase)